MIFEFIKFCDIDKSVLHLADVTSGFKGQSFKTQFAATIIFHVHTARRGVVGKTSLSDSLNSQVYLSRSCRYTQDMVQKGEPRRKPRIENNG